MAFKSQSNAPKLTLLAVVLFSTLCLCVMLQRVSVTTNMSTNAIDVAETELVYGVSFITEMFNAVSDTVTVCDAQKYKYTELLLADIAASDERGNVRQRATSADIERDYREWSDLCWRQQRSQRRCWFWNKKMRVQIIDHRIFVSSTESEMAGHIFDREGYRTGLFFFLVDLQRKYAQSLPNTDFVIHFHDFKPKKLSRYNWNANREGAVPYFFTDYNLAHSAQNLLLLTVSRAYLKYRYFADKTESNPKVLNAENYLRVADYLKWRAQLNENGTAHRLEWDGKDINKAMFRGADNGKHRKALFGPLFELNGSEFTEFGRNLDVAMTGAYAPSGKYGTPSVKNRTLSIAEQLRYRFLVVVDGVSVRDALMYQMRMGAVILKELSTNVEWWHFDATDGREWLSFENRLHLLALVNRLVAVVDAHQNEYGNVRNEEEFRYLLEHGLTEFTYEGLEEMTQHSKRFVRDFLNADSVDCF